MAKNILTERGARYERKFCLENFDKQQLLFLIKTHPACFSEFYHSRFINNIYFDYLGHENYFDNLAGAAERKKSRIRWYGDLFGQIENPTLEFKIKKGSVGDKHFFPLQNFSFNQSTSCDQLLKLIKGSSAPDVIVEEIAAMKPSLLNRYKRQYFQSADKKFRLTIDQDLTYYKIDWRVNTFLQSFQDLDRLVLELKYEVFNDHSVSQITNYFPFRLTKNSKYVIGIENLL